MGHSSWMVVLFGVTAIACGEPGAGESPGDVAEMIRRSDCPLEGEVRLLPVPPDMTVSGANAVNEHGDIAGSMATGQGDEARRFGALWKKHDRLRLLPLGLAVLNDHRVGAGSLREETGDNRAFSWSEKRGIVLLETIAPPGSGHTDGPTSINNWGTVAGSAELGGDGDTRRAVRWNADDGTVEVLAMLPGATAAEANGINDAGVVVGDHKFPIIERGKAVRWESDGEVSLLPVPADVIHSSGIAINERGEILVQVSRETTTGYGILRTDGTFDDLRLPEGHVHTFVLALNDSGLVGGYAILPNGLAEPFVWDRNQEPIPLPLPPGARGSSLVSLNDRGTAVGGSDFGGDHHRATAWTLRCDR